MKKTCCNCWHPILVIGNAGLFSLLSKTASYNSGSVLTYRLPLKHDPCSGFYKHHNSSSSSCVICMLRHNACTKGQGFHHNTVSSQLMTLIGTGTLLLNNAVVTWKIMRPHWLVMTVLAVFQLQSLSESHLVVDVTWPQLVISFWLLLWFCLLGDSNEGHKHLNNNHMNKESLQRSHVGRLTNLHVQHSCNFAWLLSKWSLSKDYL